MTQTQSSLLALHVLTLWVDWFGGGAFLLKSASEMASSGRASSFRTVKRGLSHLFLESGASNLWTNASKLRNTKGTRQVTKNKRIKLRRVFTTAHAELLNDLHLFSVDASHSHVLAVLLSSSSSVRVPRWTLFRRCQTEHLHRRKHEI